MTEDELFAYMTAARSRHEATSSAVMAARAQGSVIDAALLQAYRESFDAMMETGRAAFDCVRERA